MSGRSRSTADLGPWVLLQADEGRIDVEERRKRPQRDRPVMIIACARGLPDQTRPTRNLSCRAETVFPGLHAVLAAAPANTAPRTEWYRAAFRTPAAGCDIGQCKSNAGSAIVADLRNALRDAGQARQQRPAASSTTRMTRAPRAATSAHSARTESHRPGLHPRRSGWSCPRCRFLAEPHRLAKISGRSRRRSVFQRASRPAQPASKLPVSICSSAKFHSAPHCRDRAPSRWS